MEQGWVKLYRKVEQNDFLMSDNNAFMVFTKLLLFADKHTGAYRTGQRALAEAVNLPYGTTYKALQRLQANDLIIIDNMVKYSKIHITNWTVYQSNHEIDTILEHNAVQVGKQEKKRKQQIAKADREAHREAQGKRTGSAREDYNKKEKEKENIPTDPLELALDEFIKYRKANGKKPTDYAVEQIRKKLQTLYADDTDMKIASIHQSMERGWIGVFEVKEDHRPHSGQEVIF